MVCWYLETRQIAAAAVETPGQDVFRPIEDPIKSTGGLAILKGTLAPEGCVIKLAGHETRQFRGPALHETLPSVADSHRPVTVCREASDDCADHGIQSGAVASGCHHPDCAH